MQRAPVPDPAPVAASAPDTAPKAARAITMSWFGGGSVDRFKSVQNATRDWLKALTGADVDSAFDRRTDRRTDRWTERERQMLSLPATAAAGDIQSNCLKNAIKMYDKKRGGETAAGADAADEEGAGRSFKL